MFMTLARLESRADMTPDKQNADCGAWIFGHNQTFEAIKRVRQGGGYDRIAPYEKLKESDLIIFGIGADPRHCAIVRGGLVVGKADREGDVWGGDLIDYKKQFGGAYDWSQIYRRNGSPMTEENDPFRVSVEG